MIKATSVNSAGIKAIHNFLAKAHKNGGEHFTPDMLNAWAAEAEFQLSEGNPATIEIKSRDSVSGSAVEFTVPDEGLDWAEVWEAWEDGKRDDCAQFLVPIGGSADVAELGARALGVDVSESLNVARA